MHRFCRFSGTLAIACALGSMSEVSMKCFGFRLHLRYPKWFSSPFDGLGEKQGLENGFNTNIKRVGKPNRVFLINGFFMVLKNLQEKYNK
jgi:hypothetical protein